MAKLAGNGPGWSSRFAPQPFELTETELANVNRLVDDYLKSSPGGGSLKREGASGANDPSGDRFEQLTPEVRQRLERLGYIEQSWRGFECFSRFAAKSPDMHGSPCSE